ncbi:hypothetical protein AA11825_2005 [Acetobacter pomorum DSM 11825]|uniref:hypothetical protein n=1 Tax=Acetobacter pomorum TaxID=65959 RepID=UPI0011782B6D|nr:hypothetical protein [Acetobacter pomorum]GBR51530.1 hypothetical protein AA11825_2005 [Acetobacter pomorum DSM 11825]
MFSKSFFISISALCVATFQVPLSANAATTLVLACGGFYKGTTPPKVAIYDISTNPVTEKWSASYAKAHDIYDSCEIVNDGTQVLVSAYRDIYLFNISDGSIAKQWRVNRSHGLDLISPSRMLVSSSSSTTDKGASHPGDVQIYDFTRSKTGPISDIQMRATHSFLPVKGIRNEYYVAWYHGIRLVSLSEVKEPHPSIHAKANYRLPTTGTHDMVYDLSDNIIASTPTDIYTFNPYTRVATTYFSRPVSGVKGLSINHDNGQLMYVTEYPGSPKIHQQDVKLQFNDREPVILPQEVYRAKWVYQDSHGVYSTKD